MAANGVPICAPLCAVPQMTCIGSCNSEYIPKAIQCYNRGSDGADVQARCVIHPLSFAPSLHISIVKHDLVSLEKNLLDC